MKFSKLVVALGLSVLCLGAYAGTVTKTFDQSDFDGVKIHGNGHYTIQYGDEESISITADEDIFKKLKVKKVGSELVIGFHKNGFNFSWNDHNKIEGVITVVKLESIDLSGATAVSADEIHGEEFDIDVSGASRITLGDVKVDKLELDGSGSSHVKIESLKAESLDVDISGSSNVEITKGGKVGQQEIDLSGASNYKAENLTSDVAEVSASGASNARIRVSEQLDAELSGASNVWYKGSPKSKLRTSGASNIHAN